MKAAYLNNTGGPEVIQIGDLPTPVPKAGEVLVRVRAAGLNPIDTYIRSGAVAMPIPKPFIPGCDFAGTVDAVGPGVSNFKSGDRVWGSNQGLLGRQGTFAEYVAVAKEFVFATPANLTDEDAAAAGLTAITAHLGLFRCAKVQPRDMVFVNGGTGGVGSMVVQIAKAAGARVITTVGSAEKAKLARELGADVVIDYRTEDIAAKVKEAVQGKGVQVWFETQREPDFDRIFDLMGPWGRVIVIAGRQARPVFPVGPFYVKGLSLHGFAMFNVPAADQRNSGDYISHWLSEKKLRPLIGKRFPLEQAAAAHRLLEENTLQNAGTLTGKIILQIA